jgi:hypothetical protein
MRTRTRAAPHDAKRVLTKATLRAASLLGMTDAELAAVLGVSGSSVSRLRAGRTIDAREHEGQCALLFLRVFRSLDSLLGDVTSCKNWLRGENKHLGGVPAELMCSSIVGLVNVTRYLDALRGKV